MLKIYTRIRDTKIMYHAQRAKNDTNGNPTYNISVIKLTDNGCVGKCKRVQCYNHELEYYAMKMVEKFN